MRERREGKIEAFSLPLTIDIILLLASSAETWSKLSKDLEELRKTFQEMYAEEKARNVRLLRQMAECDASIEMIPASSSSAPL